MKIQRFLAVGAVGLLLLTACSDDGGSDDESPSATDTGTDASAAEPASLSVTATDDGAGAGYTFEIPGTVESGATRIELSNTGGEPHHGQLITFNEGESADSFLTALQEGGEAAALPLISLGGGTGAVDPGGSSSASGITELTPGSWAFVCFIPAADGVPHLAKGMLTEFEVVEAEAAAAAPSGEAVSLVDYGIQLPAAVAGDATLTVTNATEAGEPHEMNILELADGATADDVFAWFAAPEGPPPFASVGGLNAINPGATSTVELDLGPGSYLFLCNIPSVVPENEGKSHAELGMVVPLEVT
jgi:hypothetical protein